jgi:hypothetical protein
MQLINATRMTAGYNMGLEVSGRELLVVVIKGTFVLPRPGEPVRLADEQLPLIMADTFTGEPGFSSPVYEIDFAPRKQACDVLLVGSAHAPEGKAVTRMRVRLQVGPMVKEAEVVGPRVWNASIASIGASEPNTSPACRCRTTWPSVAPTAIRKTRASTTPTCPTLQDAAGTST